MGVYRRCHYAVLAEEAAEAAFRDRVSVALSLERQLVEERKKNITEGSDDIVAEKKREEGEIGEAIQKEDDKLQRQQTRASRACNFGPSFPLAFKENSESDSESTR